MIRISGLLVGFFVALGIAEATTVKPFAFDGLCETAQTIVYVRCLETKSLVPKGRDDIVTQTRFAVLQVLKGHANSELVLVLPGGAVDGRRMEVLGMPRFEPGAETVLFLSGPDAFGSPWPVGLGQGCYGVRVSADGARKVALQAGSVPLPSGVRAKPAQPIQVPLRDFFQAVRGALPPSSDPR